MFRVFFATSTAFACISSSAIGGEPQQFSPAAFLSANEFTGKLQCPRDKDANSVVTINCQANVGVDGSIRAPLTFCFAADARYSTFAGAVETALPTLRLQPAEVNGVAHAVYLGFRVLANASGSDCQIKLIPNPGPTSETADENYVAPQKLIASSGRDFPRVFTTPLHARGKSVAEKNLVRASVTVSAAGQGKELRIDFDSKSSGIVSDRTLDRLPEAKFIPAFAGGQPMTMRYCEWHFVDAPPVERPGPGVR